MVALAAAVLSFASLRDLAVRCGTAVWLAWLLPVCLDAAGMVSTRLWLAPTSPAAARRSARSLALVMIGLSIIGNGLDHVLTAYGWRPAWWMLVAVAAVPPAVLGAVVHLAVLATGSDREPVAATEPAAAPPQPAPELRHAERLAGMSTAAERVRYAAGVTGTDQVPELVEWLSERGHAVTAESARSALRRARPELVDDAPTQILLPVGSGA